MQRPWLILALGLGIAITAYALSYKSCCAVGRTSRAGQPDELAWFKSEFHLSEAEFAKISNLHSGYMPRCAEMCRQVDQVNQRLRQMLSVTNRVTTEIEQVLSEAAGIRVKCQAMMLNHFYEVSRAMPLDQGKRYLEWMQQATLLPSYHAAVKSAGASADEHQPH